MIECPHLDNVGASPELTMELGPRLNLITGDNRLGKSFLLDVAWWALDEKVAARGQPNYQNGEIKLSYLERRSRLLPESCAGNASCAKETFDAPAS